MLVWLHLRLELAWAGRALAIADIAN
eukprot:COSAG06_NODE_44878_length_359_cov_1.196154_1_plen_25_part_10